MNDNRPLTIGGGRRDDANAVVSDDRSQTSSFRKRASLMQIRLAGVLLLVCSLALEAHGESSLRKATTSDAMAERAYLTSRDATIAKIKKRDAAGSETSRAEMKQDERTLRDLESKLRRAIGPISIKGFQGPGEANLQTLSSGDIGFGALDALVFHSRSGKDNLFVTTEGLLAAWLKQHQTWWDNEPPLPQNATYALRREAFYTQAISSDAAISLYGALPIKSPPDAGFALAQLEATSQDQPPAVPDEIVVSVLKDGKISILVSPLKTPFVLAPPCDAIRKAYDKKIQGPSDKPAQDAKSAADVKRDTDTSIDDLTRLEKEAAEASLRCFQQESKSAPAFAAAANQAQALLDAISSK